MRVKTICALLLLTLAINADSTAAFEPAIDAGFVAQWQSQWAPRPIDVSSSNAGDSATLTLYLRVSVATPEGSRIHVYYPDNSSGTADYNGAYGQHAAGDETMINLGSKTLPTTSGPFGPFRVFIRKSADGPLLAMTNAFGSIYVKADEATASFTTIKFNPDAAITVGTSAPIQFRFNLTTDVWPHDLFVIESTATAAANMWTLGSPTCKSNTINSPNNYYVAPNSDPNLAPTELGLGCIKIGDKVFINGITREIDLEAVTNGTTSVNSLASEFEVTGFTAPSFVTTSSQNTWRMTHWRAWSNYKITTWTAGTNSLTTKAGQLTISNWNPVSDYPKASIVSGMTLYMDLSVAVTHDIPEGGNITLTFTNLNLKTGIWHEQDEEQAGGTADYIYLHYNTNQTDLTAALDSTNRVIISAPGGYTASSGAITISILPTFQSTTSSTVSGISQYANPTATIDDSTGTTIDNVTYATSGVEHAGYFDLYFATTQTQSTESGIQATGSTTAEFIHFGFNTKASPNLTTVTVKLYLLKNSSTSDNTFGLQLGSTMEVDLNTASSSVSAINVDVTTTSNVDVTESANQVTFSYDLSSSTGGVGSLYNASAANTPAALNLPKVASNVYTRYETYIQTTETSKTTFARFKQITITASDLNAFSTAQGCANVRFITVQPSVSVASSAGTLKLDLVFSSAYSDTLGSGLQINDTYPAIVVGQTSVSTSLSAAKTLTFSGLSAFVSGTDIVLITAFERISGTSEATTTAYFTITAEPKMKQIVNVAAANTITNVTIDGTQIDLTFTPDTKKPSKSLSLASAVGNFANASNTVDNYSMQFPAGYDITGATLSLANDGTSVSTTTYLLGAGNFSFNFPSVIAYQATCPDAGCEMTVGSVKTPRVSIASQVIFFGVGTNGECKQDDAVTIATGAITATNGPATGLQGRSADNFNYTLTFSLTPESDIPADGTLTFSLGSDWYICPGSVCSVTSGATGTCSDTTVTLTSAYTGGTAIGLSLTKLLVPIVSSASDKNYLASATSSYSGTIDTLSATPTVSMVVPTSTAVGKTGTNTNDVTIKLFPPNISTENVDFYMRFNLNKKVPANAVITISHSGSSLFTARTSANDYVFFSRGYSSVVISSGSIKITLDADLESGTFVELYVEDAFNSGSTNPTGGIRVKSEYSCGGSAAVVITDDSDSSNTASLNTNLAFTYNSTAAATMTGATNLLSASVLNAGEVSQYTFTFTPSGAVDSTDQFWIKFPRNFDETVGNTNWPINERLDKYGEGNPSTYYLPCDVSDNLGSNAECTVDHRIVRVTNVAAIATVQEVSLTIENVQNPAAGSTGTFYIYHLDVDGVVKASLSTTGPTITALPSSNITIKSITTTSSEYQGTADYTLQLVFDGVTVAAGQSLALLLPRQYNTNVYNANSTGTSACSANYFNTSDGTSDSSTTNTGTAVTGLSSCTVEGNEVTATFESGISGVTLDSGYRLDWKVNSLRNPAWTSEWNDSETSTGDLDNWYQDIFNAYEGWTYQLQVALLSNTSNQLSLVSMSYTNVNEAWLGFDDKYRGFEVNNYDPDSITDYIYVRSGTQSKDIEITPNNDYLAANKASITASENSFKESSGSLKFSSVYFDWTMFANESKIYFRVSADKSADRGLYYIDWTLDIENYSNGSTTYYNPPVKTLVEVDHLAKASFTVTPNSGVTVQVGRTTIPIKVRTDFAPATSVDVDLALSVDTLGNKVTFSQTKLNFIPDRNWKVFTVTISSDYDITVDPTTLTVRFTVTGENSASYNSISELNITVQASSEPTNTLTAVTIRADNIGRTSATLYATTSVNPAIIQWYCAAQGFDGLTSTQLDSELSNWFRLTESTTTTEKSKRADLEVTPSSSDTSSYINTWAMFNYRMYLNHLQNAKWSGALVSTITTEQSVETLSMLAADTTYQCWAYAKDSFNRFTPAQTEPVSITTAALPPAQRVTLTFTTNISNAGTLTNEKGDDISKMLAEAYGVQPERFINKTFTSTAPTENANGTAVYTWDVPALRCVSDPTPAVVLSSTDSVKKAMFSKMLTAGGIAHSYTYTLSQIEAFTAPTWTVEPAQSAVTATSATVQATCSLTAGFVCSYCLTTGVTKSLYNNQILVGLDESNTSPASKPYACARAATTTTDQNQTIAASTSITVPNLAPETSYNCYMQCFTDYPVWPQYVANNSSGSLYSTSVTTPAEESDDDSAQILGAIVALFIALLF